MYIYKEEFYLDYRKFENIVGKRIRGYGGVLEGRWI